MGSWVVTRNLIYHKTLDGDKVLTTIRTLYLWFSVLRADFRFYESDAGFPGPVIVFFKIFSMGSDVDVKYRRVEGTLLVFFGDNGFLNGIGTADAGAIGL